jgi:hypothetical protein
LDYHWGAVLFDVSDPGGGAGTLQTIYKRRYFIGALSSRRSMATEGSRNR